MRLLLVTIEPPWPAAHAASAWFSVLLRELVARGHDVTMFSTYSREADREKARGLFPSEKYDLRCFPFPNGASTSGWARKLSTMRRPYSYMFGPDLRAALKRELDRGFDVLHLESTWSGWLGLEHSDRALLNVYNLFAVDLAHAPPRGLREHAQRALMLHAERKMVRSFRELVTLTEPLQERIRAMNPRARVNRVPLGFDLERYAIGAEPRAERGASTPTVGLIGSFDWHPTYTAGIRLCTRLWPAIKRQVPGAKLQLVGRSARTKMSAFASLDGVSIHENVPDTKPFFETTDVLLYAPEPASGMKVKVIEALAYGTPVVTTRDGIEGIPAQDRVHAGVGDSDEELVARTVDLLQNDERRRQQGALGRRLVERVCDPGETVSAIEAIYHRVRQRHDGGKRR